MVGNDFSEIYNDIDHELLQDQQKVPEIIVIPDNDHENIDMIMQEEQDFSMRPEVNRATLFNF